MVNPIMEEAFVPFKPRNPCENCPTLERDVCLMGGECVYYSVQNVKIEVVRRKRAQVERRQREIERLSRDPLY